MKRLGYTRYVAQGGDWGALITELMGAHGAAGAARASTPTCRRRVPADNRTRRSAGAPPPDGLSAEESRAYDRLDLLLQQGPGLCAGDGRPPADALRARGLAGRRSPPGCSTTTSELRDDRPGLRRRGRGPDPRRRARQHHPHLADQHGVSASRLYWENKLRTCSTPFGVKIPVAVSGFPDELYPCPRSWAERAYPQAHPLQPAAQGRPFRRLGAAGIPGRGAAGRVPLAPLNAGTGALPRGAASRPRRLKASRPSLTPEIR